MDNKAQLKDRLAQLFVELEEYKLSYIQLSKDMGKGSSYVGNLLSGQNSDPSDDFYSYFEIRFHVNAAVAPTAASASTPMHWPTMMLSTIL